MNFKKIKKIHEKEIRCKCNILKNRLEDCLKNNYNDDFVCQNDILLFSECIKKFNEDFTKKYNFPFKFFYD